VERGKSHEKSGSYRGLMVFEGGKNSFLGTKERISGGDMRTNIQWDCRWKGVESLRIGRRGGKRDLERLTVFPS